MFALLAPILLQIFGESGPIGQYLKIKAETAKATENYKLAVLQADTAKYTQQMISDTTDLSNRLQATSQSFKQGTFYPLWAIVLFSVFFPSKAEVMWHNFSLMPDWFQWLFLSVYSAIWGLPFVKGGYGAFTQLLSSRRDYKLEKAKINREAFYASLRNAPQFKGRGLDQSTVNMVDAALDAGEQ